MGKLFPQEKKKEILRKNYLRSGIARKFGKTTQKSGEKFLKKFLHIETCGFDRKIFRKRIKKREFD